MTAGRHPHHVIDSTRPAPLGPGLKVGSGTVEVRVNVYHPTAGALYVVVDAVVMALTTSLSTSTQLPEFPVSDNVQFCSRTLKEPDESATLWYTHRSFST
jgi:hypothetical protein